MKLNAVVLNYNDAGTVFRQLAVLAQYSQLENIVVVDNCSSDDSLARLQATYADDEKITVVAAERNGGYGCGNNLGVRYAVKHNQATHVLIMNPDVMVSECCILNLFGVFKRHSEIGIVTAKMHDAQYGDQISGWPLRGFVRELLSMGPVSRRIFRRLLEYPETGKQAVYVDVVHGSMLMVDAGKFLEAGGYDENIFLYEEEVVLARRMKAAGYRTLLLINQTYEHEHSTSISKTFDGQMGRQRLRETSTLYYMKQYLHINLLQEWIAKLWFAGIRMEIQAAELLGTIVKRHLL